MVTTGLNSRTGLGTSVSNKRVDGYALRSLGSESSRFMGVNE